MSESYEIKPIKYELPRGNVQDLIPPDAYGSKSGAVAIPLAAIEIEIDGAYKLADNHTGPVVDNTITIAHTHANKAALDEIPNGLASQVSNNTSALQGVSAALQDHESRIDALEAGGGGGGANPVESTYAVFTDATTQRPVGLVWLTDTNQLVLSHDSSPSGAFTIIYPDAGGSVSLVKWVQKVVGDGTISTFSLTKGKAMYIQGIRIRHTDDSISILWQEDDYSLLEAENAVTFNVIPANGDIIGIEYVGRV